MNIIKFVPKKVTTTIGKATLKVNVNSPTLLFGAGIIGFGATVILASRATLKLESVINDAAQDLDTAKLMHQDRPLQYSKKELDGDIMHIYIRYTLRTMKLYAPAVIVGGLSVACLTKSHHILRQRNQALTAAYVGLEKAYDQYRERVRDAIGEDKERDIFYDTEERKVLEEGKKQVKITGSGKKHGSIHAQFFDQFNPNWQGHAPTHKIFIECQQQWANDMLQAKGYLFLNDLYKRLGLEETGAGAVCGWVLDNGDNYVTVGLDDVKRPGVADFVNGREAAVLLDFNVDQGTIHDVFKAR